MVGLLKDRVSVGEEPASKRHRVGEKPEKNNRQTNLGHHE